MNVRILLSALLFSLFLAPFACGDDPNPVPIPLENQGEDTNQDQNQDDIIGEPVPVEPQCESGLTFCDGECIDLSANPLHCGRCGTTCDEGQLCENRRCVAPQGTCPENSCTGATYCDGNTGICRPGCSSNDSCHGGQVCDLETFSCTCPEGQRLCGGKCFDLDDPEACGDCMKCPAPSTGVAQCIEGQCEVACDEGLLRCGDRCATCPDGASEVGCDGNQCVATACPEGSLLCGGECSSCPDALEVGCDGNQCVATACAEGQRPCQGECTSCPTSFVESTTCDGAQCVAATCDQTDIPRIACEGECVSCPEGGADYSCNGDECVVDCGPGSHLCGDSCVDSSSPDHCGDRCSPCPTTSGGTSQCIEERCQVICEDDRRPCADGCCSFTTDPVFYDETVIDAIDSTLDAQGNVHAVHINIYGDLYYTVQDGAYWNTSQVTGYQGEEDQVAITIAGDGTPFIFTHVNVPTGSGFVTTQLAAIRKTGSSWTQTIVSTTSGEWYGLSAATNDDGRPMVAYVDNNSYSDNPLRLSTWTGSSFSHQTAVDNVGTYGGYPHLTTDADGNPHILYLDHSEFGNPKAHYVRKTGSSWQDEFIQSSGDYAPGKLAIRPDGTPVAILTSDDSFATRQNGSWSFESLSLDTGANGHSLHLDENGVPHIAFINYFDELLFYGHRLYGEWTINSIAIPTDLDLDVAPSLTIHGDDLHIFSAEDTYSSDPALMVTY